MILRAKTQSLSVLPLVLTLVSFSTANAIRDSTGPLRGSSETSLKVGVGSHVFVLIPLGFRPAVSIPVNVDDDPLWEIAMLIANPTRVGVFDPSSGGWVDGPRELPVVGARWSAGDWDFDTNVEYVYVTGQTLRHFNTADDIDRELWSKDFTPVEMLVWGNGPTGGPVVAWLKNDTRSCGTECTYHAWNWHVYDLWTGVWITSGGPGAPGGSQRVLDYPAPGDERLILHAAFTTLNQQAHSGSQRYNQSIRLVHPNWLTTTSISLPGAQTGPGRNPPLSDWSLENATLVPDADLILAKLVWFVSIYSPSAGYSYRYGASWLDGSPIWAQSYGACPGCPFPPGPFSGFTAYDLDQNGAEDIVASRVFGPYWEIRNTIDGQLTDSVSLDFHRPSPIRGSVLHGGVPELYFVSDSNLYVYHLDKQTGVFDNPEGPQYSLDNLSLAAHPNPFNSDVTLTWSEIDAESASITIYNVLGQSVFETSVDGQSQVTWDGCDSEQQQCPSGIYIARMTAAALSATTKVVLLR